jgi:hypothetical protein
MIITTYQYEKTQPTVLATVAGWVSYFEKGK